jgi:4-amino-4-deoxy-L-arabinose transferase-like glycosyltransferase
MNNRLSLLFFGIILLLFFYDIGNLNALRQGTEGFYLLISQEMYEAGDFLTPRIYGNYHWSKPPFQFWLPIPLYHFFGGSFLMWARVSVLLFSLGACFLISLWYEKELKRNWYEAFGFLICPLYFIKYSRIFMMELALAYLSTLGALYFYSYFKKQNSKNLLAASFISGLSVLVKGPVSLVMIFPPAFFLYLTKSKKQIKPLLKYGLLTVFFGSLWFVFSYLRFGREFFDYFFIRENLGKFTAKSYPIKSVIQGLFIYSFPVFLFLFPIFKSKGLKSFKEPINQFLGFSFICFYFLWFLPKQKSHHYAVPAIPILCLYICYNFKQLSSTIQKNFLKSQNILMSFFMSFGFILLGLLYFFRNDLVLQNARPYFLGALFCLALWTWLINRANKRLEILVLVIPFIFYWQFLLPLGILPTVPEEVIKIAKTPKSIFVSYRKPFFVQEALERDITLMPSMGITSNDISSGDFVFISREEFSKSKESSQLYEILNSWRVWKRGSGLSQVLKALKNRDLKSLQEHYIFAKKK